MATKGFAPPDDQGFLSEQIHLTAVLSFLTSIFGSAIGMTKFILSGPLALLPKETPLNGMISTQFGLAFLLNLMFGLRIFAMEFIFFTSYHHYDFSNSYGNVSDFQDLDLELQKFHQSIEPILQPEYRLMIYLAPCALSLLINVLRLAFTARTSGNFFVRYPQFILSPMFSPFMYEGCQENDQGPSRGNRIRVWMLGSILNSFFIGVLPHLVLIFSDFARGVTSWEFKKSDIANHKVSQTDALIKHPYGNLIFSLISISFFTLVILAFFCKSKWNKTAQKEMKFDSRMD